MAEALGQADPIESALAEAVARAAGAVQWTTVEILSRELSARRVAWVSPGALTLEAERAKRERELVPKPPSAASPWERRS